MSRRDYASRPSRRKVKRIICVTGHNAGPSRHLAAAPTTRIRAEQPIKPHHLLGLTDTRVYRFWTNHGARLQPNLGRTPVVTVKTPVFLHYKLIHPKRPEGQFRNIHSRPCYFGIYIILARRLVIPGHAAWSLPKWRHSSSWWEDGILGRNVSSR